MAKSPAFQFYPTDFMDGVILFSNEEIGIYIRLLCYQWNKTRIPLDFKVISKIGATKPIKLSVVLSKFEKDADGYYNVRMELERLKQKEYREKQAENGRRGGRPTLTQPLANPNPSQNLRGEDRDVVEESEFCIREGIAKGMLTNGFPGAWRDWKAYRSEKGESLTSYSAASTMQNCLRWGPKLATEIIRKSIDKSWKNLLDPSEINHGNQPQNNGTGQRSARSVDSERTAAKRADIEAEGIVIPIL